ncbi:uncharacterized protein C5orf34 homolog isoform X1 [Bufo bufo]|uniref:uncharacterized protein C5orf34 homolog isoform X1 n=1 Tax=Bufo bufo TaxID=8384 RepID=UPI001ABE4796|nr:uncharacterized protein C5orf34 homolog isoform X1 [Bufo bufo]
MSAPRALLLYTDDSVEVQYRDGARLFVSPCGTEFMYERPQAGAHPVQRPQRGRHRTEFVTSSCREQVLQALSFRNTFSSRPFLPCSLIPSEEIMTLLAEISEATWPALEDDTGGVTHMEDGTVKVSSLDGHADLYMNTLQKEFTVKFLCQLSCAPCDEENTNHNKVNADPKTAGIKTTKNMNRSKYSSCVLQEEPPSCLTKHASQYTWLVQRFSVADCPPSFQYPMDLALLFHRKLAQQGDAKQFVDTDETKSDFPDRRTVSALPRALPLTCPAAHMHRMSYWKASLEEGDKLAVNSLPLKVVIYDGALYRFILDGTNVVEIYPGDGSVFISEGDGMGKYFQHFFIQTDAKQVEDRLYTARDLPPDKPRALYSVRSVISQARRFLEFCCKHKLSLNPVSHTCCWRTGSGPDSRAVIPLLLEQSFIPNQGRFAAYSNNTVCASYLDGVLLYMIWNFANFNKSEECPASTVRHERFSWCCLRFPDGSSKLVEMEDSGEYASYIGTAVTWCRWLDEKSLGERRTPSNTETDLVKGFGTVARELEKIQRFNFLLENSSRKDHRNDIPSHPGNAEGVQDEISEMDIQSILEKTSKAIQDIDLLLSSRKS